MPNHLSTEEIYKNIENHIKHLTKDLEDIIIIEERAAKGGDKIAASEVTRNREAMQAILRELSNSIHLYENRNH
jgi:hypothetical protein